ncbi:MAG TPA: WXG100 family type VII secretion target [Nocardioides sp.]|nr:WXG100 family type VII secretion target [Nocardioides sp.]
MTTYAVDLALLASTARDLESFEGFLDQRLAELDRVVADLHVTWTGQAASAHEQAHREWVAAARRMRAGLRAMRLAARAAHDDYQAAGRANATMWRATR